MTYILQHRLSFLTLIAAMAALWGILAFFLFSSWQIGVLLVCLGIALVPSSTKINRQETIRGYWNLAGFDTLIRKNGDVLRKFRKNA
jgi:hypothetical protein